MSNCQSCKAEKLCVYEYKPCDCFDMRKFKAHPDMKVCEACDNSGTNPYPLPCKECNGLGVILATTPNKGE
jgi:RecJ-like exonuclease